MEEKITKKEMAKVIVQALYALDHVPSDYSLAVKKYTRWTKARLQWPYDKACKIIKEKKSKPMVDPDEFKNIWNKC